MISQNKQGGQPRYIIKMAANPGKGDLVSKLTTNGIRIANEGGVWMHCLVENEPDTLWSPEFFESKEAKAKYEESDLADQLRNEILELIGEPLHLDAMRISVTPFSASWLSIKNNLFKKL